MTSSQKAVKYLAIVLAVLLIIGAVVGIGCGIKYIVTKPDSGDEKPQTTVSQEVITPETPDSKAPQDDKNEYVPDKSDIPEGKNVYAPEGDIKILEINAGAAQVNIIKGKSMYVQTDNRNIKCSLDNSKLTINAKHRDEEANDLRIVTVCVPENKTFDRIEIAAGAGDFNAELIKSEVLNMHIAAGDMVINDIEVLSSAQVDFAAGRLHVSDGKIKNLAVNMAVGSLELDCEVEGRSEFICGGGNIELNLPGKAEKYKFEQNSILCIASVNGTKMEKGQTYGTGENSIEINGLAGNVSIKTAE